MIDSYSQLKVSESFWQISLRLQTAGADYRRLLSKKSRDFKKSNSCNGSSRGGGVIIIIITIIIITNDNSYHLFNTVHVPNTIPKHFMYIISFCFENSFYYVPFTNKEIK